jgi:hypothetical protein
VSIAQQSAMPQAVDRRRPQAHTHPLQLARAPRRTYAFLKILVLVAATSIGAALAAGAVAVALLMLTASFGS